MHIPHHISDNLQISINSQTAGILSLLYSVRLLENLLYIVAGHLRRGFANSMAWGQLEQGGAGMPQYKAVFYFGDASLKLFVTHNLPQSVYGENPSCWYICQNVPVLNSLRESLTYVILGASPENRP